jgi:hypothetical protein
MDVLLFLNGVLLSRLVFIFNDSRLPKRSKITVGIVQIALCFLVFSFGWPPIFLALMAVLILLLTEFWLPEDWLNESRFISLLVILVATIALHDKLQLAPWMEAALIWSTDSLWRLGDSSNNLRTALWFLLGFLLVANEANLLIRSILHRFHLEPRVEKEDANNGRNDQLDQQEYKAGRIIGILERWLMYSVLFTSQNVNVIALIIAAKGFARFRQMDERPFAEYVLIGTLASTLLTVLVAQIASSLSGN